MAELEIRKSEDGYFILALSDTVYAEYYNQIDDTLTAISIDGSADGRFAGRRKPCDPNNHALNSFPGPGPFPGLLNRR